MPQFRNWFAGIRRTCTGNPHIECFAPLGDVNHFVNIIVDQVHQRDGMLRLAVDRERQTETHLFGRLLEPAFEVVYVSSDGEAATGFHRVNVWLHSERRRPDPRRLPFEEPRQPLERTCSEPVSRLLQIALLKRDRW